MQQQSVTTPTPADLHALISDLAAVIPDWDPSRPISELSSALKERLSYQPRTQTGKRRGKSMSRRKGQLGRIEKHGKFYTLRVWMDVEGQEKREHVRIKICPVKKGSPGWLNSSERQNRAKEIIHNIGANSAERFDVVVKAAPFLHSRTFAEQAKIFLEDLRNQEEPLAKGTLDSWEGKINKWLIPMLGDMPLEQVKSGAVKRLVAWMKGGPGPSGRQNNA